MDILKFNLRGKTAFFKRPDVNTFQYFTYGTIHKVALLGILGSILGLKGYNHQFDEKTEYPEFYEKLKDIKISIVPSKDFFSKKVQIFNNSVGYASYEVGGNLIIKEQWLEDPEWDVYILLEDKQILKDLKERLLEGRFTYIPYLGKNDHFADISEVNLVQGRILEDPNKINSYLPKNRIKNMIGKRGKIVEETLPIGLTRNTNQYIFQEQVLTSFSIELDSNRDVFLVENDSNKCFLLFQ